MGILASINSTLFDVVQRTDPTGAYLPIVEILNTSEGALNDVVMTESNGPTSHVTAIRSGIPAGTFRAMYQAVQPEKSTVIQVSDTIGNLESFAEVDAGLADLNGKKAEWMMSEHMAFIEGLSQNMRRAFYYADEKTTPAKFTGLHPRYNTFTVSSAAPNAVNVINAGGGGDGAGNMQSAWLLTHGLNTLHGIYPKGSQFGGLFYEDDNNGERVTSEGYLDSAGATGRMKVYRRWYKWQFGLTLKDWRYNARVCNISVKVGGSNTASVFDKTGGGTNYTTNLNNLLDSFIKAAERLPSIDKVGKTVWYVSRQVREAFRFAILNKLTSNLTWETVEGHRVMMFDGIPVVRDDALTGLDSDGTTSLEPVLT